MTKEFEPLAVDPRSFLKEDKPAASATGKSTGEMIAADQANLAANPPPEPPRSDFSEGMTRVGGAATGAALGAATQIPNMIKFGDIPENRAIKTSIENTGSIGKPLTKWELMTQQGQNAEVARLNLRDAIDKWKAGAGQVGVDIERTGTQNTAAGRALQQSVAAEQAAQQNLVNMGGGRTPPPPPPASIAATAAPTGTSLQDQVQHTHLNDNPVASSLAREISHNEYTHYRAVEAKEQVRIVNEVAKRLRIPNGEAHILLEAGPHLTTASGLVMLPISEINRMGSTPEAQARARMTPAERHTADLADAQRAAADLIRRHQYAEAERVLNQAHAARMGAASNASSASADFLGQLANRSGLSATSAPSVQSAQDEMIAKRRGVSSVVKPAAEMVSRGLPIVGGIMTVADAGDLAGQAYNRSQRNDPIGATIAGLGAGVGALGLIPTLPTAVIGGVGDLAANYALSQYDKYTPAIHAWLEKQGLPQSWNPEKYSVMQGVSPKK